MGHGGSQPPRYSPRCSITAAKVRCIVGYRASPKSTQCICDKIGGRCTLGCRRQSRTVLVCVCVCAGHAILEEFENRRTEKSRYSEPACVVPLWTSNESRPVLTELTVGGQSNDFVLKYVIYLVFIIYIFIFTSFPHMSVFCPKVIYVMNDVMS